MADERSLRYLTLEDVCGLHAAFMILTEDPPAALTDPGKIEAALMRAQNAAHYEGANLIRQAALMAAGIVQAHAFVDGNKRAAAGALDIFLRRNGCYIESGQMALAAPIESLVVSGAGTEAAVNALETWVRANSSFGPPQV